MMRLTSIEVRFEFMITLEGMKIILNDPDYQQARPIVEFHTCHSEKACGRHSEDQ